LDNQKPAHRLSPYSTLPSAEPTYATAVYPFYDLQDPSTTLFLSSVRDHPIRLSSALAPVSMASYSLVNPMTEAFITPHSMIYPSTLGGTHFLTGSDSLICLFDVSRPGTQGPISSMPTIPSKRKQIVGGGIGMKGIVSALAVSPTGDGILAAGTFTRHVGLYNSNGSGESLGTFSIAKTAANRDIGGRGITQLAWSPCGRYLYIAERRSDGILVYDVRVTGQMLGHLRGRKALTNQRMKIEVVPSGPDGSHEVWAGGTDGFMRVWKSPEFSAGGQDPDAEFKVHDGKNLVDVHEFSMLINADVVTSAIFHPMGNVAATCSGQRHYHLDDSSDEDDDDTESNGRDIDNSLKVWSMPFLRSDPEAVLGSELIG
jgi:WD40 repeat protein